MRAPLEDPVGVVLFGKGKRAILSQLMGNPERRFFVREIARGSRIAPSSLTRDLSALADAGLIVRSEEGRQVYYQANRDSPVFPELRGLVTKTFGVADVLRSMLAPVVDRVRLAAVYGSIASGTQTSQSDVDLLIVGDVTTGDLSARLMDAEQSLSRKINPTIYPEQEFEHARQRNPFLKAILAKPTLLLIGDPDDLSQSSASKPR